MITIVYETECHCGGVATSSTLAMDQPEEDGCVHIDVDMSVSQTQFECDSCGCVYYTSDVEVYSDDESSCSGADEEESDDES